MAIINSGKEKLDGTRSPFIPYGQEEYSRAEYDYFINLLRMYFSQIDGFNTALIGDHGSRYLSTPYGAFQSTVTQTAIANTATPMYFNTIDFVNGISMVGSTKITVEHAGMYNLQWSGEFQNADNLIHDVSVWLRQDGAGVGVDIPGSTGVISLSARKSATEFTKQIVGWNYYIQLQAGEFVELWWSTPSALVSIIELPISGAPVRPSTASLVVTMSLVSRL